MWQKAILANISPSIKLKKMKVMFEEREFAMVVFHQCYKWSNALNAENIAQRICCVHEKLHKTCNVHNFFYNLLFLCDFFQPMAFETKKTLDCEWVGVLTDP